MSMIGVPSIELRPFEKEIIDGFKVFAPLKGRGGRTSPHKGVWVRGHLLSVPYNEDYAYSMWKRWVQFCKLADVMTAKVQAGTYDEFRTYLWMLSSRVPPLTLRVGSRIDTRQPRHKSHSRSPALKYQPVYYSVNPSELGNPLWENPWRAYDSHRRWARRKFKPLTRPKKKRKPRVSGLTSSK